MPVKVDNKGDFLKVELNEKKLPSIGANGILLRRSALNEIDIGDYFLDTDVMYELVINGHNKLAKAR